MNPELHTPSAGTESMAPGMLLRMARRRAGLSLEEAARAANLTLSITTAMEEDDYARLGLPVYARGYYRRYARVVQCEAATVVAAYEAINDVPSAVPQIMQRPSIPYGRRSALQRYWPVGLLLVVGGALVWGFLGRQPASEPKPAAVPLASAFVTPAPTEVAVTPEPLPDVSAARRPTTVDLQDTPVTVATEARTREGDVSRVPDVPRNLLEISVGSEPAWVEVVDAASIRLAYKIAEAGETLRLQGDPPYRLNLGRAYSLTVRYGGQPVDLRPYTDAASRARATIASDGRLSGS